MRRFLKVILHLGRYAVLPVVAFACAVFVLWLMAIDRHTTLEIATAPLVLSATPAVVALALGILLLPLERIEILKLTRRRPQAFNPAIDPAIGARSLRR